MSNHASKSMATASILAISAFIGTATAYAQDSGLALETITVTGTKGFGTDVTQVGSFRGAKLVDTPMTVNVLPKDLLDAQFAVGMNEALRNVAGVTNSQTSTVVTSGQSVRGIPLDNRNAYRLDGGLPLINLMELPTEDKERVELLKGASGLYYGFASPAGVVNLTMKRPTTDTMVSVRGFGNEYGALGAAIDVGGTTAGGFGYRLNGMYGGANYGIKGVVGNRSLLAGAFDYHPIDSVAMQVDYEHIYKSMPEPGFFSLPTAASTVANPYPTIAIPNIHAIDPKVMIGTNQNTYRAEETNIFSHNVWSINEAWQLTADVGDSHFQRQRFQPSITVTAASVATNTGTFTERHSLQSSENQNGRLDLSGTFGTFGLVHNVSVGYTDNVRDSYAPSSNKIACAGGAFTAASTTGAGYCNDKIATVNGVAVNYANALYTTQLNALGATDNPAISAPTQRVDDAGAYIFDRVSYENYIDVLGGVRFGNYHENNVKPVAAQNFHAAPTTFAGSVILKPLGNDDLSVYGSYIEALQTTSAAGTTAVNIGFQPPPTNSYQRELGVKYVPWKGVIAQASYFNIGQGNATIDANGIFGLNGRNKFDGFDGSITGDVTDDWSITVGGLMMMAKVAQAAASACVTSNAAGVVLSSTAFNGTACAAGATYTPTLLGVDVENTPKVSGSLFTEYKLRGISDSLDGIAINGGLYYTGARYTGTTAARARVGDYTLLDLGASYSTDAFEYPLTFRVAGHNITNRRYWAATGQGLLALNQPSNFDFSIETHL